MKKEIFLILIAFEVLIFAAMLLGDFGIIAAKTPPLSPKGIIMHITTIVVILICIDAYRRNE